MTRTDAPYDCTRVAEQMARRLLDAGRPSWLGAVRDIRMQDGAEFHAPLIHGGFTWNVHYLCCSGDEAFEPLLGDAPVPVADVTLRLFGRRLDVLEVVGEEEMAGLQRGGTFRERVKTLRRKPGGAT